MTKVLLVLVALFSMAFVGCTTAAQVAPAAGAAPMLHANCAGYTVPNYETKTIVGTTAVVQQSSSLGKSVAVKGLEQLDLKIKRVSGNSTVCDGDGNLWVPDHLYVTKDGRDGIEVALPPAIGGEHTISAAKIWRNGWYAKGKKYAVYLVHKRQDGTNAETAHEPPLAYYAAAHGTGQDFGARLYTAIPSVAKDGTATNVTFPAAYYGVKWFVDGENGGTYLSLRLVAGGGYAFGAEAKTGVFGGAELNVSKYFGVGAGYTYLIGAERQNKYPYILFTLGDGLLDLIAGDN